MKLVINKNGFSFLEVMITIAVLSVGILGVLSLIASSMKYSINSRDGIIASELAQEGVELVRNLRDQNLVNGSVFPFSAFPAASTTCRIGMGTSFACAGGSNYYNLLINGSGFYDHTGTSATKFQRRISISYYTGNNATAARANFYSIVAWGGTIVSYINCTSCTIANKCVCVQDVLTSW